MEQGSPRCCARRAGIGLIELLISLLVLNLGIFATMGAFTSGAVAIRNASRVSTASALADKKIEAFRDMAYSNPSFAVGTTTANQTGADGLTYSVTTAITSGSQLTTGTYQGSTAVKVVTLTISERSAGPSTGRPAPRSRSAHRT